MPHQFIFISFQIEFYFPRQELLRVNDEGLAVSVDTIDVDDCERRQLKLVAGAMIEIYVIKGVRPVDSDPIDEGLDR